MMQLDLREAAAAAARDHRLYGALPEAGALRPLAIGTWTGRMINETCSARVFEALSMQLHAAGFSSPEVAECAGFADEERRHGVLCGAVVHALGGPAVVRFPVPEAVPVHEDAAPLEGALRNLISICCLSETVAVALIGAERLEMPKGALRSVLDRIYADEVGHARFGWQLLARCMNADGDAALRSRLDAYLRVAFRHLEEHELAHLPITYLPADSAALGICDGRDSRGLFYDTVERVIVPGLEAHGLRARAAWNERLGLGSRA